MKNKDSNDWRKSMFYSYKQFLINEYLFYVNIIILIHVFLPYIYLYILINQSLLFFFNFLMQYFLLLPTGVIRRQFDLRNRNVTLGVTDWFDYL
jgi:hypothetical protein